MIDVWLHRGHTAVHLENSLEALTRLPAPPSGIAIGIEFDVRLTADRRFICYHDPTLDRLHQRPERINQTDSSVLEQLGLASLEQLLSEVDRSITLNIEIKYEGDHPTEIDHHLTALRTHDFSTHRVIISSFNRRLVEALIGSDLGLPIAAIAETEAEYDAIVDLKTDLLVLHRDLRSRESNRPVYRFGVESDYPVADGYIIDPVDGGYRFPASSDSSHSE